MNKNRLFAVFAIVSFVLQACHGNNQKEQEKLDTQRRSLAFIKNSMISGLCEVKASGYAITNSNDHRVIDLDKMVITEQTAIDSELVKIKTHYRITVKDSIDAYDMHWIDSLSKKSGRAFDKQYVTTMVGIHRGDSLLYTIIAKTGYPELGKFVQKNLPAVSRQLDSAIAVSKSLK